ncbi:hypothetical protein ACIRD6_30680 [Streptomyces sp. NPDC102473]|uniref:hypothetical protein n=1 Tax=Streptomyces sp. NPDC102473 TaxID=3366180 RepID=UPI0037FC1983
MSSRSTATLRSRYVAQAASDLEENHRRQQELAAELTLLKQEEALLSDILTLAERHDAPSDPSRLPEQAQREPVATPARPVGAADAAPASPLHASTGKTGSVKKTRESIAKAASPQRLLGDVLLELLSAHKEPRLARELRDELLEKHRDRTPTPQVVRNTLESLVAKGRIRRQKQQRSVMYCLVEPSPGDAGTA